MPTDSLQRIITRFRGLHKNVPLANVPEGAAAVGENWWVQDGRIEGIPGYDTLTAPATAEVQEIAWYKPKSGSDYVCCVCGGDFYERGTTPTQWTKHSLTGLVTADAVSVTITTTVVTPTGANDDHNTLAIYPEIGDTVYVAGDAASLGVTISEFYGNQSELHMITSAAYTGSTSGSLVLVPDALATTGKVSMAQLGNMLVISDGDRPMIAWDGTRYFRLGLMPVKLHSAFANCLTWEYTLAGAWNNASYMPHQFRIVWHNEDTGEYSSWQEYTTQAHYEKTDPTATCGLTIDMTNYPYKIPEGATHAVFFLKHSAVSADEFRYLTKVPVAGSVTLLYDESKAGDDIENYAAGYDPGDAWGWDYPFRPPGTCMRGTPGWHHGDADNSMDEAFRGKPPFPLVAHRGVLMGLVSNEPGRIEGSGWPSNISPSGGIMEPWAWGYHNWHPNPSDGEDAVTMARAGGRAYMARENSLYQMDDRAEDPALWKWDKLRVGVGFIDAMCEYGGRLWGIVRTRKGQWKIGVYDGMRMRIDPRLGDLSGYDRVAAFGSLLIVAGGDPTYFHDGETGEWYGYELATLSAVHASPGDGTYDFYVGKANGNIYRLFTGNAGNFSWESGGITFAKHWLPKNFRRVAIGLKASGALTDVKVEAQVDEGGWVTLESSISVGTSLVHWKSGIEGMDGKMIQFKITSASTSKRLYIEYLELDADIMEGVRDSR